MTDAKIVRIQDYTDQATALQAGPTTRPRKYPRPGGELGPDAALNCGAAAPTSLPGEA